jgi:PPOX class probable F420-dependent enzyme
MSDAAALDLGSSEASASAVERRLQSDTISWLVTTRPHGRPHAVPVWFLWHDGRLLIMSEPDTVKVKNLRRSPHALLHLDTDATGNGVVVLTGPAVISERSSREWLPAIGDAYTAKYADGMKSFGMGLEAIAERFSVVIELTPDSLTAW